MEIRIFTEKEQNKQFYGEMGRFFADKKFFKLFGEPLYNEPKSVWFIAYDGPMISGFCASYEKNTHIYLNNFYVLEEYRGTRVGSALFKKRLDYFAKEDKQIRGMVKEERSLHLYLKNGFEVYGHRGYYNLVRKG